jgi:hypothetical protein
VLLPLYKIQKGNLRKGAFCSKRLTNKDTLFLLHFSNEKYGKTLVLKIFWGFWADRRQWEILGQLPKICLSELTRTGDESNLARVSYLTKRKPAEHVLF